MRTRIIIIYHNDNKLMIIVDIDIRVYVFKLGQGARICIIHPITYYMNNVLIRIIISN